MGNYYDKEKKLLKAKNDNFIRGTMAEKKKKYTDLYIGITDNLGLGFEELLNILEEKTGTRYTKEKLQKILTEMSKDYNYTKALEALYIVNYAINKDKNNEDKMNSYLSKIQEIKKNREKNIRASAMTYKKLKEGKSRSDAINKKHEEVLKEANEYMDKVINKEDHTVDEFNIELSSIKKFLKEIDKDKYIEFIVSHYDIKNISIKELKEIREIAMFFKDNLKNNVDFYSNTNKKEFDKINKLNSIHVVGEEDLDEIIKNTPSRLFKWKLAKIEREYEFYCMFLKVLDDAIDKQNFDTYKEYSNIDKRNLELQEDFIKETNNKIKIFNEIYQKHIKGIKTINQKEYEELDNKYKKRLIKE